MTKKKGQERYDWIADNIHGNVVYDMGCVKGELHSIILDKYPDKEIIGVDIERGGDKVFDLNKPFPKIWKKADTIIAGEIIEHLENPYGFLKQCYKLLNSDGRLVITTPNINSIKVLFNIHAETADHIFSWSMYWLKRVLRRIGFEIIEVKHVNMNERFIIRLLAFFVPTARRNLHIIALR